MGQILHTLSELEAEARAFALRLATRAGSATLITLSGELGAGKTAFVKAVASALGVEDPVTSPTFVLEKIYLLPRETGRGFSRLIHIDAYRLESGEELDALGFDEILKDPENLILLEWPEQVEGGLPAPAVSIRLETEPDGSRAISYG